MATLIWRDEAHRKDEGRSGNPGVTRGGVLPALRQAPAGRSERWDSLAFQFPSWLKSSVVCGVGEDAEYIAERIAAARRLEAPPGAG
jgi:hypothetical protein